MAFRASNAWRWALMCFLVMVLPSSDVYGQAWSPKADVIIVVDSTDTVGRAEYDVVKDFLKDLVKQWDIGPNGIQVSTLSYGHGVHKEFNLNEASTLPSLLKQIDTMPFRGGASDASDAFKYAHEIGFTAVNGARSGIPHVIIHVTDEPANDLQATVLEADKAFDKGITVYSLGVGPGTGKDKLQSITSDPLSRYLLNADTFSSLKSLVPTLSSRINNEVPVSSQQLPKPSSCLQKADLVFLVDSSSSVGQNDFQHLEDFLKDFIIQLPIGQDGVRVGLVQFANYPSLEFGLDTYTERMSLLRAIDSLTFMGGGSNIGDAISYTAEDVFSAKVGARYQVPHIAVVITDGQSTDGIGTTIAADQARLKGISLLAVGVGDNVDVANLQNIANDPTALNVFQSRSYKDLKALSRQILDTTCNITTVATPPPTLPPGVTTVDPCYDAKDNCAYYSKETCSTYEPWSRTNCNKYCGFCTVSSPTTPCQDDVKCSEYGTYICSSQDFIGWARQHCQQYCGFCPKGAVTAGYYGKCFYKGREYGHNEKWLDGCDYECVCEDGQTGTHKCYNRCPVYRDLPSQCTLIAAPGECCLQPVCDFDQKITSTQGSGKGYNPQGVEMCEYGGVQYYDGQTWEVGCDLKCTCTDAKTGTHVCQSYCPTYQTVPNNCQVTKKPGDCCPSPVCEFETLTGIFTGDGTVSGDGVEAPPPDRSCVDKLPDCRAYGKAACQDYPEWAQERCGHFCDMCVVSTPAPSKDDFCWYDGKSYVQNDTWSVGCDRECTCEVAAYGYYRCVNKCPEYSDIPSGCMRQKKVGECCPVIVCDKANFNPSATKINTIGNGGGLTMVDPSGNEIDVMPTVPTNLTATPVNTGRGPRLSGCLFHGKVYVQAQQWQFGCSLNCLCVDASTGVYECRERCPKYDNVPSTCRWQPDPSDPCCTYPADCGPNSPYIPLPVYAKGVTNVGAVMSPSISDLILGHYTTRFTVAFDGITLPQPTTPASKSTGGYCIYKAKKYAHGKAWEDGCDFNCVCEDGLSGTYRCIEKCQHYVDLPPQYCHLETDPNNPCCQRPICNFTAGYDILKGSRNETLGPFLPETTAASTTASTLPVTTPKSIKKTTATTVTTTSSTSTTITTQSTIAPSQMKTTTQEPGLRPLCIYKGSYYTEGQVWYDGCDYKCSCDDAARNMYTCLERCPSYPGDFTGCSLVPLPSDAQCCSVPECQGVTLPPGRFTGRNPNNNSDMCVYKGQQYADGDVWEDGCQFQCECTDANLGLFLCIAKCPSYASLPAGCKLVDDFINPCCQVPQCDPTNSPDPVPRPGMTTVQPPLLPFCEYMGARYFEGQTWRDGCQFDCRCENATEGVYTCSERCQSFPSLTPGCQLVTDDQDPCCQKPDCSAIPPIPGKIPTLPPGTIQGNALVPNKNQIPIPGQKPIPGQIPQRGSCIYDGVEYGQGDEWYDGCDYTCQCVNASTGAYTCVERCTRFPPLPPECQMVKNAADPCCQLAVCDPNYITLAPNPKPNSSTMAPGQKTTVIPPTEDVCVYKGQAYTDGQTWFDGCAYECVCEDAEAGLYRCTDRCPSQPPLPQGCTLVSDPRDPVCCEVPYCSLDPEVPGQKGQLIPTLAPAKITGRQVTPSPLPGDSPLKDVCVYDGVLYREGQRWADGCEFNCECENGTTGQFSCTEMCPRYASLPPQCVFIQDVINPCCQTVYCDTDFATPPTLSPQQTMVPGVNIDACIYNGVPYAQGERWQDGCDLKCLCEDAKQGNLRCDQRCPTFDQVPSGCSLETDPDDACCQVMTCQPGMVPTASPLPYPFPYLVPIKVPGKVTGQTVNTNGNVTPKGCIYKGKLYGQGDFWEDRCDSKCVCVDEESALYQCTERCLVFEALPSKCQLVPDPNDPCCEVPKCDNSTNSTPMPGVPTVSPPQPGRPTLVPNVKDVCESNEAYYQQGQQWYEGCDKLCVCTNATLNQQACSSRCATFENIPPNCRMVADPQDPSCCKVPQCIPTPGDKGYPSPAPTYPGDPKPTPTTFINIPGVVTGLAPKPNPTPDPNGGPTQIPDHACVYKGQDYRQGMRWQDGCAATCECVNETIGLYRCDQRCASYPIVPAQCRLLQDPNDFCCRVVSCDFSQTTPNPFAPPPTASPDPTASPPTLDPNSPSTLTPDPNAVNTPLTRIPLATPPTLRPDLAMCVYNGVPFSQGATWTLGCDRKCRCEDATTNLYTCADRCPTYMFVPPGCSKMADPSDPCCSIVQCVPDPTMSTVAPNSNTNSTPTPYPTLVPGVITGKPGPGSSYKSVGCIHNGVAHRAGDKWSDGCAYNCECLDDQTGQYRCTERCPNYINVPSSCSLTPDPNDLCCETLTCFSPTKMPTPDPKGNTLAPPSGQTPITPMPPKGDVCIYDGQAYTQDQLWYDGCQQVCVCEDAKSQYIRCTQRCPVYPSVPPSCVLVPDPNDPVCCQTPHCDPTSGTNVTGYIGQVSGAGTPPMRLTTTVAPVPGMPSVATVSPPFVLTPAPRNNSCYYKGVYYTEGQRWKDSCEYECQCIDGATGLYNCQETCPHYTYGATCPKVRDPNDPCCLKPDCSSPSPLATPTPGPGQTTLVPAPSMPTPYPVPGYSQVPQTAFCVYNGMPFKQFETWNVGCDLSCRCEDAVMSRVNCDQRCPTYASVPPGCQMVTDPYDACCQIPSCVPKPGQVPDPNITGVVGTVTGNSLPVSVPGSPKPAECVYKGVSYKDGVKWDDGCQYQCECVDGAQGKYVCFERCMRYPAVPSGCSLTPDPLDPCCETLSCAVPTPSPAPNTGGKSTPGMVTPSADPGVQTLAPGEKTTMKPPTEDVCVYNGQSYRQGQVWYDGCSLVCSCDNATVDYYSCRERCTRYDTVPAACIMTPDPQDPSCCQIPSCPITPAPGPIPTPGPVASVVPPGVIVGVGKVPDPTPIPTPAAYTGTTAVPPTAQPGCVYKGVVYDNGEAWSDGCDWDCQCVNGTIGFFKCTAKCVKMDPTKLPPECILAKAPGNQCCDVPICDFLNPTPFPNGIPTLVPNQTPVPPPNTGTTLSPGNKDFCVYKGAFYSEGEQWTDGCDLLCVCDDAKEGFYSCSDRCSSYPRLPDTCKLVTDPDDSCCLMPQCSIRPSLTPPIQPSPVNGTTLIPGTNAPSGSTYVIQAKPPATFFGQGGSPSVQPGDKNPVSTGYSNACMYKGKFYSQGQQFEEGCQYRCSCIDALRGRYECVERCPSYVNVPSACSLETDPQDSCCQIPVCVPEIPTSPKPSMTSSASTATPSKPPDMCDYGGKFYKFGEMWQQADKCEFQCMCDDPGNNIYTCHNACPVYSQLPSYCRLVAAGTSSCCKKPMCNINGTNVNPFVPFGKIQVFGSSSPPTQKPGPDGKRTCVYKGEVYLPGETWYDGCDLSCQCVGEDGTYSCLTRCPDYSQHGGNCTHVKVPGQCCDVLQCDIQGAGPYNPVPEMKPMPIIIPGPAAKNPTLTPSDVTDQTPQLVLVPSTGGNTGGNQLPGGGYPLPTGGTAGVMDGIRDRCVYDGKLYNQGETWDPDCDLHCTCMDQRTGFYKCTHRCTIYEQQKLPQTCSLIKTGCCQVPQCTLPNGTIVDPIKTPQPSLVVVGTSGKTVTGSRPVYQMTLNTTSGRREGCVYGNHLYKEGESWTDGCDYRCECENGRLGLYKCLDLCPSKYDIQPWCRLEAIPNECCPEVICSVSSTSPTLTTPKASPRTLPTTTPKATPKPTTTTVPTTEPTTPTPPESTQTSSGLFDPDCRDLLPNCEAYGSQSCKDPYVGWAKKNCNLTCNFCTPSFTTTPTPCVDLKDCGAYGRTACTQYTQWAQKNCRSFCGLCDDGAPMTSPITTVSSTTSSSECADRLNNCKEYGQYICQNSQYTDWVNKNCAAFCSLCTVSPTPPTTATTKASLSGWSILLKGVSGVPGDLAQLWQSNATLNANNPQAMTLTPEFKDHYKSEKVNQWDNCQFQEVKVAVYSKGVEEGNVIFDVRGLDRTAWFRPDRIVSSTWDDIKSVPSGLFSIGKSALTGREFSVSDTAGCNGRGWLFVSTTNTCDFEKNSPAPRFFFSLSSKSADLSGQVGEADVFAIFGRGGNCAGQGPLITSSPQPQTTPKPNVCLYNGTTYQQGDKWSDGCAYDCSCVDASSGRYVCNDKCPTYPSLPPSCTLQTKAGECCAEPICGGIEPLKGCYYKGSSYSQGAQWSDGCDFECTCVDALVGDFRCKSICPRWNLPSQCSLGDPAPGLCCKTPKCPFKWVPPAGYVPR